MTSKEKLIEKLNLDDKDFNATETTENDSEPTQEERLQALESAMLEIILGGAV